MSHIRLIFETTSRSRHHFHYFIDEERRLREQLSNLSNIAECKRQGHDLNLVCVAHKPPLQTLKSRFQDPRKANNFTIELISEYMTFRLAAELVSHYSHRETLK